jgi:hypothetical protein
VPGFKVRKKLKRGHKLATSHSLFQQFLETKDTLWVYLAGKLHFRSAEEGTKPLLTYLDQFAPCPKGVTIFDRIVGNAAALLLKMALCKEVYSLLGSELAAETLKRLGIAYSFLNLVTYISNQTGNGMCPFEKASVGKSPEEFYQFAKEALRRRRGNYG